MQIEARGRTFHLWFRHADGLTTATLSEPTLGSLRFKEAERVVAIGYARWPARSTRERRRLLALHHLGRKLMRLGWERGQRRQMWVQYFLRATPRRVLVPVEERPLRAMARAMNMIMGAT